MRSSSLLILALVIGTFGCKKKEETGTQAVVAELEHYPLSEVPNRGKAVDITCWSAGTKIFEGQAVMDSIIVRGERIFHFRSPSAPENDGVDTYVRVTGDCVARYTARRE